MRKVVKAKKVCGECGSTLINEEYDNFCDWCKEKIPKDNYDLRTDIFWEGDGHVDHYEFCTWRCVFGWFKNMTLNKDMINFITLPYVSGDFKEAYKAFWAAVEEQVITLSTKQREESE